MSNTKKQNNNSLSIDNIVLQIFQDIYDSSHHAEKCTSCHSENIRLIDEASIIYKCSECNISFSPKTNSLFQSIRYSNDKWLKILKCMINDDSLETTLKITKSSAESIKRRWTLIHENVDWRKYNILVRDKPTKNIYADFDVMIG